LSRNSFDNQLVRKKKGMAEAYYTCHDRESGILIPGDTSACNIDRVDQDRLISSLSELPGGSVLPGSTLSAQGSCPGDAARHCPNGDGQRLWEWPLQPLAHLLQQESGVFKAFRGYFIQPLIAPAFVELSRANRNPATLARV